MSSSIRILLLLLVSSQGLHSVEEYIGKLWNVLPPARIISGLVSDDLEKGFVVVNISLFIFGILCWLSSKNNNALVHAFIWFWILIETINGIGHPAWALFNHSYEPGLITAPLLLTLSLLLSRKMLHRPLINSANPKSKNQ